MGYEKEEVTKGNFLIYIIQKIKLFLRFGNCVAIEHNGGLC